MPVPPLRLTGYAHGAHVDVIARIRDAIDSAGGFILDCHLFSNAIVVASFEMSTDALSNLRRALESARVVLDARSASELARRAQQSSAAQTEASLSVNLIHDEPDLRIEVPAVPG